MQYFISLELSSNVLLIKVVGYTLLYYDNILNSP